jgi:hypothetical protein
MLQPGSPRCGTPLARLAAHWGDESSEMACAEYNLSGRTIETAKRTAPTPTMHERMRLSLPYSA